MYGYELRSEFEARTGGTWPLNIGQVYSTLARLERDGLIEAADEDGKGHVYYRITAGGRQAVHDWFATPVSRMSPPRDELAIKLAMAVSVHGIDVREVVQAQRTATMKAIQEYTLLKPRGTGARNADELAWLLVLDSLIFQAEAEIRWLDHCEARLARAAGEAGAGFRTAEAEAANTQEVPG
jgi:DNA-binding PadR family transcriptional regulator